MNGNPLQYSCLENPTNRRAWWATVHGVKKSQTQWHGHTYMNLKLSQNKMPNFKNSHPTCTMIILFHSVFFTKWKNA